MQTLVRWYGFAFIYPGCDIYCGLTRGGDAGRRQEGNVRKQGG